MWIEDGGSFRNDETDWKKKKIDSCNVLQAIKHK
jgi:hypothetical protein